MYFTICTSLSWFRIRQIFVYGCRPMHTMCTFEFFVFSNLRSCDSATLMFKVISWHFCFRTGPQLINISALIANFVVFVFTRPLQSTATNGRCGWNLKHAKTWNGPGTKTLAWCAVTQCAKKSAARWNVQDQIVVQSCCMLFKLLFMLGLCLNMWEAIMSGSTESVATSHQGLWQLINSLQNLQAMKIRLKTRP